MRSLLAWCMACVFLAGIAEPAPLVFTVGVLRRDAIIVPFATYDGKDWKDYWPDPANSVDTPMNLQSVPKKWWGPTGPLDAWQVWAGPQPQTVHVRQPDWLKTYCQRQIGLRTDYRPRVWPPAEAQPYPKDGLAVSPPQAVEPIERLSPDSGEAAVLQDLLRGAYATQEDGAVTRAQQEGADVRPDMKALATVPITLEALYAFGKDPRVYWVESSREYKEGGACRAVLFGNGWLMFKAGQMAYAAFRVEMVPCNRQTLQYMLPLGALSLPTGTYWIGQWSGWDNEAYGIFKIGPDSIEQALGTSGGACPIG